MCLTDEFFNEHEKRITEWNTNGLSINEACSSLSHFYTITYPIATEVAGFIYKNWTLSDVDKLPDDAKATLLKILEPCKVNASTYLDCASSNSFPPRPFVLIEDIPMLELLNSATSSGTEKDIYQKCLSILYLKNSSIFKNVALEITQLSTDRVFLGYSEEEILNGKNKPAEFESRVPIKLLVGKPIFTYGKLSNSDKLKNIEKFFTPIFKDEDIEFDQTDFYVSLTKKLNIMPQKQARKLLEGLI